MTPQVTASARSEAVADAIRQAILDGGLAPGQRLVEADLSQAHGASRGAVRAALVDLTHEGLVERIANRGARVRVVGVDEAVEITEVRMALEGLCAAKAAGRITDDGIAELRRVGDDMRRCVDEGDVVTYSQLNRRLHVMVIEAAGQGTALDILTRLRGQNVRHQFRLALRPGRPRESLPQHLAIIDAVCARDPDAAKRAMRAHLADVIRALREPDPSGPAGPAA